MELQVILNHRTLYRYEKPILLGPQVIQLRPAPHCRVPILSYALNVTPGEHRVHWQMDHHSNRLARLLFPDKTDQLVVDVSLVADLSPTNPFDFLLEPGVEEYPFTYRADMARDLQPFRFVDAPGPRLAQFLAPFQHQACGTVSLLLKVNRAVCDQIAYGSRLDPGV